MSSSINAGDEASDRSRGPGPRNRPSEADRSQARGTGRDDRTGRGDRLGRDGVVGRSDAVSREGAVAREKERYGGIKVGSAFFGWLTATGTAVLLTALAAAAGTAVGVATNSDASQALDKASKNPQTVGIVGIIILLAILFVAYYCGGYVAGRMARFNGPKQGLMVWIWAVIIAVVVAILGLVAGNQFNILASLNSFPRIPVDEGQLTGAGIIALVVVAVVSLGAAMLGGLAGMHFHRKVDKAGFAPLEH
ncbi:hypothetical protein [Arthrobacter sp. A5]|uniref:hypothetical protein n=1 Tax=Arthrobacter sp. A5 TaxID=576926 RepID=UPI003DA92ABB